MLINAKLSKHTSVSSSSSTFIFPIYRFTVSNASSPSNSQRAEHKAFSLARVWALATSTLTHLVRMKVFYFLIVFVMLLFVAAFLFFEVEFEQQLKLLKDINFGAMSLFSVIFAIVGTAILIPKDVEDRTLYTILSKPVPRFEYLLGKLLGVILLVGISLAIMDVIFVSLLQYRQGHVLAIEIGKLHAMGQGTPDNIQNVTDLVLAQGVTWDLQVVVLSIFLKAVVLASMALLLSTFATSTLFTIVVGFALFFVGHGQSLAREYFLNGELSGALEKTITIGLTLLFPDLQVFNIVDGVVAGESLPGGMILRLLGITALYVFIYNLVAIIVFTEKEL